MAVELCEGDAVRRAHNRGNVSGKKRNGLDKVRKARKIASHAVMNPTYAPAAMATTRRFAEQYRTAVACVRNELCDLVAFLCSKVCYQSEAVRATIAIGRRFPLSVPARFRMCRATSTAANMSFRHCWSLLSLAAVAIPAASPLDVVAAEGNAPQYLLFQIFTGSPDPGGGVYHRSRSKEDLLRIARSIADTVRREPAHPDRNLGFSVGPITMDEGDDGARSLIRDAFDVALATDMAVALHLDDYMFWAQARWPDGDLLGSAKDVTEWRDWSATPMGGLGLGWMPNARLAPQMCYESPAAKDFVTYWTRDVIGKEIKKQTDRLVRAGKAELFAGVMVGWESNLAFGYCSLSFLGYSAQNSPYDFDYERERVLHRHIERWAKGIYDAGIPRDLIFTHIGPISKRQYQMLSSSMPASQLREIHQSTAFRAFWSAFNSYSNPGFSAYPADGLFDDLYQAIGAHGRGPWAMAEGVNLVLGPGGATQSPLTWETYLARNFNHGARIVNLFGAFQGPEAGEFKLATESAQALAAYHKFLQGNDLIEDPAQ